MIKENEIERGEEGMGVKEENENEKKERKKKDKKKKTAPTPKQKFTSFCHNLRIYFNVL